MCKFEIIVPNEKMPDDFGIAKLPTCGISDDPTPESQEYIKPGNIFVSQDYTLKIGDFGMARYNVERSLSPFLLNQGTESFRSPDRETEGASFHTDMWSEYRELINLCLNTKKSGVTIDNALDCHLFKITRPQILHYIVAIDIGSNCSTFSFTLSKHNSALKCKVKTLTVISLDKYGKLARFGDGARHDHNAIFSKYKMVLFNTESREKTMVKADNCNQIASVETLFTETLKYFKQTSLESLNDEYKSNVDPSQVLWVITVPDTSDNISKKAILLCAIKAGLCTIDTIKDSIRFVGESKAGAMDCISKTMDNQIKPEQQFLVLNLGRESSSFNVYKKLQNGFEIIDLPLFVDCGSNHCDIIFKNFLVDLLGITSNCDRLDQLVNKFKLIKESMAKDRCNDKGPIIIQFTPLEFAERINQRVDSKTPPNILYDRSRSTISIPFASFVEFFLNPIFQQILGHLKSEMNKNTFAHIFMIGGFSENYVLQQLIKKEFASTNVIVPQQPSLSVVRGACRLAICPSAQLNNTDSN
ncbi:hypothetical protein DFA_11440 [Cavenderia fasciculata]|uniref:Uncharacterized protein n=1 Tax=Cavenderia fasciculata TaxID=261658 RepID=F4QCZ8_CACFS|nr:uncharacterized protein DFA_11440 [Cavenderia fasciculata]EGG13679.1 hypothetical protein DFA_11440 [Cavenderia fasciculata]|eukprot:XP_004350383.1 hypothetical protein DFA_11440 [Cavenderia fasciculata]